MGIKVEGMPEMIELLRDEEIMWSVKRKVLREVAEEGRKDAEEASFEIRDTGFLERNWKTSFYSDEGVASASVYSTATHDIYNELGSPTNMAHVGFFSRAVDANENKYLDMMEEGILDDSK